MRVVVVVKQAEKKVLKDLQSSKFGVSNKHIFR